MGITREELLRLAHTGAAARVKELRRELDKIYKTFPDLQTAAEGRPGGKVRRKAASRETSQRNWSAADRKAVSDRMKKYWATRRAPKGAKSAK